MPGFHRPGLGNMGGPPGAQGGMPGFGMLGPLGGGLPPPQSLGLPADTPPDIVRAALIAGLRPNIQVSCVDRRIAS
jgi:hypothetical protein